jgi:predicted dehydrogenase
MANEIKTPNQLSSNGSDKKAGFAIIGIGKLTESQLLPAFKYCEHAKPAALVGGDTEKMQKLARQYGINEKNIYSYETFDSIRLNREVDAVYIVLPNSMHKEFTVRAAEAGKHILCEKPMSVNITDAKAMIEVCKRESRKLMIAYRIQYEPHHRLMKEWVRNDVFGKVKMIESFNGEYIGDPSQWRFKKSLSGGGALVDLGIYCINTVRFLKGEEPVWVFANTYSTADDDRFKEVEEAVAFELGFADGTFAVCSTSYSTHKCQRYRCFTHNAWFGMDPAFPYQDLKIEISTKEDDQFPVPVITPKNQFALMMDHMAKCILEDTAPDTPGEEGLKDQLIIDAIYKSAKEKKIVEIDTLQEMKEIKMV